MQWGIMQFLLHLRGILWHLLDSLSNRIVVSQAQRDNWHEQEIESLSNTESCKLQYLLLLPIHKPYVEGQGLHEKSIRFRLHSAAQLKAQLTDFLRAYDFARSLKTSNRPNAL